MANRNRSFHARTVLLSTRSDSRDRPIPLRDRPSPVPARTPADLWLALEGEAGRNVGIPPVDWSGDPLSASHLRSRAQSLNCRQSADWPRLPQSDSYRHFVKFGLGKTPDRRLFASHAKPVPVSENPDRAIGHCVASPKFKFHSSGVLPQSRNLRSSSDSCGNSSLRNGRSPGEEASHRSNAFGSR